MVGVRQGGRGAATAWLTSRKPLGYAVTLYGHTRGYGDDIVITLPNTIFSPSADVIQYGSFAVYMGEDTVSL